MICGLGILSDGDLTARLQSKILQLAFGQKSVTSVLVAVLDGFVGRGVTALVWFDREIEARKGVIESVTELYYPLLLLVGLADFALEVLVSEIFGIAGCF